MSVRFDLYCSSVCCECCILSGRGLCVSLITRPVESYRLWCLVVCDLKISRMRRPWPTLDRRATGGKKIGEFQKISPHFVLKWKRNKHTNNRNKLPGVSSLKHNPLRFTKGILKLDVKYFLCLVRMPYGQNLN